MKSALAVMAALVWMVSCRTTEMNDGSGGSELESHGHGSSFSGMTVDPVMDFKEPDYGELYNRQGIPYQADSGTLHSTGSLQTCAYRTDIISLRGLRANIAGQSLPLRDKTAADEFCQSHNLDRATNLAAGPSSDKRDIWVYIPDSRRWDVTHHRTAVDSFTCDKEIAPQCFDEEIDYRPKSSNEKYQRDSSGKRVHTKSHYNTFSDNNGDFSRYKNPDFKRIYAAQGINYTADSGDLMTKGGLRACGTRTDKAHLQNPRITINGVSLPLRGKDIMVAQPSADELCRSHLFDRAVNVNMGVGPRSEMWYYISNERRWDKSKTHGERVTELTCVKDIHKECFPEEKFEQHFK